MIWATFLFLAGALASGFGAFAGAAAVGVAALYKALSMGCVLFSGMSAATGLLRGKF